METRRYTCNPSSIVPQIKQNRSEPFRTRRVTSTGTIKYCMITWGIMSIRRLPAMSRSVSNRSVEVDSDELVAIYNSLSGAFRNDKRFLFRIFHHYVSSATLKHGKMSREELMQMKSFLERKAVDQDWKYKSADSKLF